MDTRESLGVHMKTYIRLTFDSEGAKPSNIVDTLCMLGFKPTRGHQDLVYEWDRNATVQVSIWFADKIHLALAGLRVHYELETLE